MRRLEIIGNVKILEKKKNYNGDVDIKTVIYLRLIL